MSLFLNLLFETNSYSNEYFLATFGFDTAENEPCKVCQLSVYRSPRQVPRGPRRSRGYNMLMLEKLNFTVDGYFDNVAESGRQAERSC